MLLNIAIVLFSCYGVLSYNYTVKYIELPVDHFSFTNNATFKLKYLENNDSWIEDGPIFFYTGNEGEIEGFAENTGFMFDIAPQFNALLIFAEHRYYGESLPFGNDSFSSPQHIGYLTSTQALADFVYLINHLQSLRPKSEYLDKVPVVAFGGSYGGMLSAWLRMKYPADVIGAIAASAPIWQFQGLTPCENFNKVVTSVYKNVITNDCSVPIQKSWKLIRNVTESDAGKAQLSKDWKLCTVLKTKDDVEALIDWYGEIIVNMAMVNYPYPNSFLAPLPAYPVKAFCQKLMNSDEIDDENILSSIGAALEIYTNYTQTTKCNNINYTAPNLGENAWNFQACTEMIMPMCSTDDDMFENSPWDFKKYSDDCFKEWGIRQTQENFPILEYGGKDISSSSNIVFSNGLLDPWSAGGVLNNVSDSAVAIIIPEGAHHLDLRSENSEDPESVRVAREFHISNIKKWIRNYYYLRDVKYFKKSPIYYNIGYKLKN